MVSGRKQVMIWLPNSLLETSEMLRNLTMQDDGLVFFRLKTHSKNAWYAFIFEMGLIAIKKEYEKFKKNIEQED